MNSIGLKKKICMLVDRLFKIDRRAEYGLMDKTAYLAPDTILFNKKNLYMEEHTSIPGGAMILNPRSKFIMKKGSFSSYNLCVCPGNHASLIGKFKHDVTDAMKDELFPDGRYDKDIVVEEDVWMGINVTLLNGAHIGRGAIIGAGCVVTGEIPPYAIAVGHPCQVKRFLFTPEEIIKHENELYPNDERYPLEELIAIQQKYSK